MGRPLADGPLAARPKGAHQFALCGVAALGNRTTIPGELRLAEHELVGSEWVLYMTHYTRSAKYPAQQSTLRIIGGQWRGRKLSFTPAEGLRPTPDRVRETLFNWLSASVNGARCLDLFAGSGALGLEALSRGAISCDFVDSSAAALRQIEHHLHSLEAGEAARCHAVSALSFLQGSPAPYDIVFIDPPFGKQLIDPVCAQMANRGLVANDGFVYVEAAVRDPAPAIPVHWRLHRDKVAGEVAYRLFEQQGISAGAGSE
jgi:16S rRNA (guanine966-N2)-methyltransferase